ncbi:MAG: exosome complex exonuclease Rrp41 [Candidatus Thermoplasmatota archaeon]|jgi:exosome complex component RRP41|nr:exosome complex exonuclease Rrp41 [Candidatus Thermoplasmatota archaeon]MCL5963302.1 exosome complex exonuclease Rrp41 [Candidatus Thermoplasmatota archaeon]
MLMSSEGAVNIPKLINENGLRIDGRTTEQLRDIKIDVGVLKRATGSAYIEWGENKILAAVYGPREAKPRHIQNMYKAVIQCKYNMAPFSVDERKRPGIDRRSTEISKVIAEAIEGAVIVEQFPRASIDVYIEVLQANAGTRCAGLTAASVALADAGIPMKDLIAACAVGKIDGQIVLDLRKEEDNFGQADLPFAMVPKTEDIVLMQMDGHLNEDEFKKAIDLAKKGCKRVYELEVEALKEHYKADMDNTVTDKVINNGR